MRKRRKNIEMNFPEITSKDGSSEDASTQMKRQMISDALNRLKTRQTQLRSQPDDGNAADEESVNFNMDVGSEPLNLDQRMNRLKEKHSTLLLDRYSMGIPSAEMDTREREATVKTGIHLPRQIIHRVQKAASGFTDSPKNQRESAKPKEPASSSSDERERDEELDAEADKLARDELSKSASASDISVKLVPRGGNREASGGEAYSSSGGGVGRTQGGDTAPLLSTEKVVHMPSSTSSTNIGGIGERKVDNFKIGTPIGSENFWEQSRDQMGGGGSISEYPNNMPVDSGREWDIASAPIDTIPVEEFERMKMDQSNRWHKRLEQLEARHRASMEKQKKAMSQQIAENEHIRREKDKTNGKLRTELEEYKCESKFAEDKMKTKLRQSRYSISLGDQKVAGEKRRSEAKDQTIAELENNLERAKAKHAGECRLLKSESDSIRHEMEVHRIAADNLATELAEMRHERAARIPELEEATKRKEEIQADTIRELELCMEHSERTERVLHDELERFATDADARMQEEMYANVKLEEQLLRTNEKLTTLRHEHLDLESVLEERSRSDAENKCLKEAHDENQELQMMLARERNGPQRDPKWLDEITEMKQRLEQSEEMVRRNEVEKVEWSVEMKRLKHKQENTRRHSEEDTVKMEAENYRLGSIIEQLKSQLARRDLEIDALVEDKKAYHEKLGHMSSTIRRMQDEYGYEQMQNSEEASKELESVEARAVKQLERMDLDHRREKLSLEVSLATLRAAYATPDLREELEQERRQMIAALESLLASSRPDLAPECKWKGIFNREDNVKEELKIERAKVKLLEENQMEVEAIKRMHVAGGELINNWTRTEAHHVLHHEPLRSVVDAREGEIPTDHRSSSQLRLEKDELERLYKHKCAEVHALRGSHAHPQVEQNEVRDRSVSRVEQDIEVRDRSASRVVDLLHRTVSREGGREKISWSLNEYGRQVMNELSKEAGLENSPGNPPPLTTTTTTSLSTVTRQDISSAAASSDSLRRLHPEEDGAGEGKTAAGVHLDDTDRRVLKTTSVPHETLHDAHKVAAEQNETQQMTHHAKKDRDKLRTLEQEKRELQSLMECQARDLAALREKQNTTSVSLHEVRAYAVKLKTEITLIREGVMSLRGNKNNDNNDYDANNDGDDDKNIVTTATMVKDMIAEMEKRKEANTHAHRRIAKLETDLSGLSEAHAESMDALTKVLEAERVAQECLRREESKLRKEMEDIGVELAQSSGLRDGLRAYELKLAKQVEETIEARQCMELEEKRASVEACELELQKREHVEEKKVLSEKIDAMETKLLQVHEERNALEGKLEITYVERNRLEQNLRKELQRQVEGNEMKSQRIKSEAQDFLFQQQNLLEEVTQERDQLRVKLLQAAKLYEAEENRASTVEGPKEPSRIGTSSTPADGVHPKSSIEGTDSFLKDVGEEKKTLGKDAWSVSRADPHDGGEKKEEEII